MNRRRILYCALLMALRTCLPVETAVSFPITTQELAEAVVAQTLGRKPVPGEEAALPSPTASASPAPSPTEAPAPTPAASARLPSEPVEPSPSPTPAASPGGVKVISYTDGEDGTRLRNYTEIEEDWSLLSREALTQTLPDIGVQVLLVHTHGTEAYFPDGENGYEPSDTYHTTDNNYNVIHLGDRLQALLTGQGFTVAHIRAQCDYPSYTGSYERCQTLVESALEEEPEIAVVIDIHRDAIGDEKEIYRTMTTVNGEECAQLMLVMGTGENGLAYPQWRENLKLAMALVQAGDEMYPGLFRPIHLVPERYNQQLTTGSLLLEVGTTGNTLAESERAVEYLSEVLGKVLKELEKEDG